MGVWKSVEKRNMRPKMSVRRGDHILVTAGKDKGKRGHVTRVLPEDNRVVVDGVNIVKRHRRRQGAALQAGIVEMPAPLSRANIMVICPSCDKPTRISKTVLPNGTHARVCKACNEIIDKEQ